MNELEAWRDVKAHGDRLLGGCGEELYSSGETWELWRDRVSETGEPGVHREGKYLVYRGPGGVPQGVLVPSTRRRLGLGSIGIDPEAPRTRVGVRLLREIDPTPQDMRESITLACVAGKRLGRAYASLRISQLEKATRIVSR